MVLIILMVVLYAYPVWLFRLPENMRAKKRLGMVVLIVINVVAGALNPGGKYNSPFGQPGSMICQGSDKS